MAFSVHFLLDLVAIGIPEPSPNIKIIYSAVKGDASRAEKRQEASVVG